MQSNDTQNVYLQMDLHMEVRGTPIKSPPENNQAYTTIYFGNLFHEVTQA